MSSTDKTLWPIGAHTPGKHIVLREYLNAWLPILGSTQKRILIVDGFAGPGRYQGGEDGSPVIALKTLRDHSFRPRIQAEIRFVFIEADRKRAEHLSTEIAPLLRELGPKVSADVVVGAFDATMSATLSLLEEQKRQLAPAFVMIDPFGVSDTPLSVIEQILENDKSEVYVSFMWEFVDRFHGGTEFPPHLDTLFGCDEWRQMSKYATERDRKRFVFDLYKRQLKRAGATNVVHFELYNGNNLVYAIFFATKNAVGCDKMKQAIWKIDRSSGVAFRSATADMVDLLAGDLSRLKRELQQAFGGREVSVDDLIAWIMTDATDHHSHQLKTALRELERAGFLEVVTAMGKRNRGTFADGKMTVRLRAESR